MNFLGLKPFIHDEGKINRPFLLIVLALLGTGLIMMFSASYANALYYHDDSTMFIRSQLMFAVLGIGVMMFVSTVNYQYFKKFAPVVYIISVILLIVVLFLPEINYVKRWIVVGPINFQPSEVAKFAITILFAALIDSNFKAVQRKWNSVFPFVGLLVPVLGLLLLEPHLSGMVIILCIAALMLWVGGINHRWFILGIIAAAAAALILLMLGTVGYASTRIEVWLDPFADPRGDGYQTIQSLYAIASGGLYGAGIGASRQKYLFLPEPQNDFVFAIVSEELGFVGATIIILMFVLLIYQGFKIALRCKDRFGTLIALGLVGQIGIQTMLNLGVVTGLLPNTGISLPFFSYGGTSMLMLMAQVGIVLAVSRHSSNE